MFNWRRVYMEDCEEDDKDEETRKMVWK